MMKRSNHMHAYCRVLTVVTGLVIGSAQATDLDWNNGAGTNLFNAATNWAPIQIPTSGDTLIFDLSAADVVTNDLVGLQIGDLTLDGGSASLTLAGNAITLGGGTMISNNSSNDLILDLPFTGSGSALFFNGTHILKQQSDYTGGTALAGTLRLGINDALPTGTPGGSDADLVMGFGLFDLNGFDQTLSKFDNGTGSFRTNGGTLAAIGDGIVVQGGSFIVDDGGAVESSNWRVSFATARAQGGTTGGSLHVQPGGGLSLQTGTVQLASDASVPARLLLESAVTVTGTSAITSSGSATNSGFVDLGSGSRIFDVAAGGQLAVSAEIRNGNLTKTGDGVFRTTADNKNFTGEWSVGAGTIEIDGEGSLGDPSRIHIASGAHFHLLDDTFAGGDFLIAKTATRITGDGTLTFGTTGTEHVEWDQNVTVAPGNSPGSITIVGDVDWHGAAGGGTYEWELFDAAGTAPSPGVNGDWDFIYIQGNFYLDLGGGGTIDLLGTNPGLSPNLNPGDSFEIIRADNLVTDASTLITLNDSVGFALPWTYSFVGNSIFLTYGSASAVPEPATWATLAVLLACIFGYSYRAQFRS